MDFSFWRPIPKSGYTCLGDIGQKGYSMPALTAIYCVRSDLVKEGSSEWLWNDKKSGSDKDVSLYQAKSTNFYRAETNFFKA